MRGAPSTRWQRQFGPQEPQLCAAFDALDADAISLFQGIVSRIGYARYAAYPVEIYKRLARLALFDLFSTRTDQQKLPILAMGNKDYDIDAERAHPLYPEIKEHVQRAMHEEMEKKETPGEILDGGAVDAAKHLKHVARYSNYGRERTKAARDFVDRAAPKVQKMEMRQTISLDEETRNVLAATIQSIRTAGHLGSGPERLAIDAGVIDVEPDVVADGPDDDAS